MARDLTRGGIIRNLLLTSIPTSIGFGAQMLYDLVDLFWISLVPGDAVAGVTVFTTLFWVAEALNEVIGTSSVSLISQAFGAGNKTRTDLCIEQTITFKFLAASIAALLFAVFLGPLMRIFISGPAFGYGLAYGYVRVFFLPVMFSSYSVNTILRCIGDAATPMKIMLAANLGNAILAPLFIFKNVPYLHLPGLGLGVFGAALATIIMQCLAFALGFLLIFTGRKGVNPSWRRLFRLDPEISRKLITIGLPTGLEVLVRNLSAAIVLGFVAVFHKDAVTAAGIGGRILGFAFMPLIGLAMGGAAMIGQSLGAEDLPRAEKTARGAGLLAFGFMLLWAIAVLLGGRALLGCYSRVPAVVGYGWAYLLCGSVGLVFLAYGFGLSTAFSGSGYNLPFLVASLVSRWGIQLPLLLIAIKLLDLPILWLWLSYAAADLGESLIYIDFFRRGRWRTRRV